MSCLFIWLFKMVHDVKKYSSSFFNQILYYIHFNPMLYCIHLTVLMTILHCELHQLQTFFLITDVVFKWLFNSLSKLASRVQERNIAIFDTCLLDKTSLHTPRIYNANEIAFQIGTNYF